jgi:hypothetical protein
MPPREPGLAGIFCNVWHGMAPATSRGRSDHYPSKAEQLAMMPRIHMLQIVRQPSDWTAVSRNIVCHEPSGLLFELMPGARFGSEDAAPPDRLFAKSFVVGGTTVPITPEVREQLAAEAVLMALFLGRYLVPRDITPKEQTHAA